jgi:hypothetical protein
MFVLIASNTSWPGLSRSSTSFLLRVSEDMDARDKPGHDELVRFAFSAGVC